ncbi:hypothetical protein HN873_071334, partial [Arachis hypogaea]
MHAKTIVLVDPSVTTNTHQITIVKSHSEVYTKMIDMVDPHHMPMNHLLNTALNHHTHKPTTTIHL